MSKPKEVQIERDGITALVLEESVDAWSRNGWTVVDDGSSESGVVPEPVEPTEPQLEAPAEPGEPVVVTDEHEGEAQ